MPIQHPAAADHLPLRRLSLYGLVLLSALAPSTGRAATIIDAFWQGRTPPPPLGDDVNWSDPLNWSPNGVPKNVGDTLWYNVTIPGGATVTYDGHATIPGPAILGHSELNNLTLANDGTLILTTSGATQPGLTINGSAILAGILDVRAGTFTAPTATFFDGGFAAFSSNRARVYASGGAVVTIGASSYDSRGLLNFKGMPKSDLNLFTATGAGTLLDLSSMFWINAGFYSVSTAEHQLITASSGGKINLSNLIFVDVPGSVQDYLQFTASGAGSEIDLSRLRTITSPANGSLRIVVDSAGKIIAGRLWSASISHITVANPGSQLIVNNGLWVPTGTTLTQGAGTFISIGTDLSLEAGGIYTAGTNSQVHIGRDFLNSTTDPNIVNYQPAAFSFTGAAPTQVVEAAGEDVGLAPLAAPDFAMGAMRIGEAAQPATVLLMDIRNNGNRTPAAEALYLNDNGADINQDGTAGDEGLYVAAGSTLVLNGLSLYAYHDGALVKVAPTASWPNGGGAIVDGITGATGDVNFDATIDARDIDLLFEAVRGASLHPFFDINGNGSLSMKDVDFLIQDVLHTEFGDANLDGTVDIFDLNALVNNWQQNGTRWADGDFNSDGFVNAFDLNTLAKNWQFGASALPQLQSLANTPVPEPMSLLLMLPALMCLRRQPRR